MSTMREEIYHKLHPFLEDLVDIACDNIEDLEKDNNNDSIIFPQTIGSITFYTSKELIDWVCIQQDSNYGIGNGA